MIGLSLCIGLLLGMAIGFAGAWAWIESRRDREEDAPASGGGPTVGMAHITAALAKTFDASVVQNIARSTPMLELLKGGAKVEWSAPPPRPATTPSGFPGPPEPLPNPEAMSGLPVSRSMTSAGPGVLDVAQVMQRGAHEQAALAELHAKVATKLVSERPCAMCGEPVGVHEAKGTGILCPSRRWSGQGQPEPPEAA